MEVDSGDVPVYRFVCGCLYRRRPVEEWGLAMNDEALRLLENEVEQFYQALGPQREWLEKPQKVDDYVYKMRTRPGFIFDDAFWGTFHGFVFKICHVAYYGPERLEDADHRKPYAGVFELRFALANTPACDAEKAVLVQMAGGALECAANDLEALAEGVEFERGENAPWALVRKAIDRLYADTSPAAAALLAQGERCGGCRLHALVFAEAKRHLQGVLAWVPDNDARREAARFLRMSERQVRAALAPGEEKT